jgi:lipoate-protein ligase B
MREPDAPRVGTWREPDGVAGRQGPPVVWWVNLGVEPYEPVLDLQHRLVRAKHQGWPQDVFLLLEHTPVFTLGRNGDEHHVLARRDFLEQQGIAVLRVERGGEVTYHGPGQLVGYPVVDLNHFRRDIRWYVRSLGEMVIRTLADYGVAGTYDPAYPGVWVEDGKICAVGCKNERWTMYHGFAFNLDTNPQHWQWIVPCGLLGKGVANLKPLVEPMPTTQTVRARLAHHFEDVFNCRLIEIGRADLEAALADVENAQGRATAMVG